MLKKPKHLNSDDDNKVFWCRIYEHQTQKKLCKHLKYLSGPAWYQTMYAKCKNCDKV
jgi:hypothetical protein